MVFIHAVLFRHFHDWLFASFDIFIFFQFLSFNRREFTVDLNANIFINRRSQDYRSGGALPGIVSFEDVKESGS